MLLIVWCWWMVDLFGWFLDKDVFGVFVWCDEIGLGYV